LLLVGKKTTNAAEKPVKAPKIAKVTRAAKVLIVAEVAKVAGKTIISRLFIQALWCSDHELDTGGFSLFCVFFPVSSNGILAK